MADTSHVSCSLVQTILSVEVSRIGSLVNMISIVYIVCVHLSYRNTKYDQLPPVELTSLQLPNWYCSIIKSVLCLPPRCYRSDRNIIHILINETRCWTFGMRTRNGIFPASYSLQIWGGAREKVTRRTNDSESSNYRGIAIHHKAFITNLLLSEYADGVAVIVLINCMFPFMCIYTYRNSF